MIHASIFFLIAAMALGVIVWHIQHEELQHRLAQLESWHRVWMPPRIYAVHYLPSDELIIVFDDKELAEAWVRQIQDLMPYGASLIVREHSVYQESPESTLLRLTDPPRDPYFG